MTRLSPISYVPGAADAGRQLAQLREVLALVEQLGGRAGIPFEEDFELEQTASLAAAYLHAPPVVQKRFDALATEIACWAAAGLEALAGKGEAEEAPAIAANALADEMRAALRRLTGLIAA